MLQVFTNIKSLRTQGRNYLTGLVSVEDETLLFRKPIYVLMHHRISDPNTQSAPQNQVTSTEFDSRGEIQHDNDAPTADGNQEAPQRTPDNKETSRAVDSQGAATEATKYFACTRLGSDTGVWEDMQDAGTATVTTASQALQAVILEMQDSLRNQILEAIEEIGRFGQQLKYC